MISDMNSLFRRKPTNIFSNPNLSAQISHRYYVLISQSVNSSQNPQIPLIKSLRTSQISKFRVPSRVFSTQSSTLELQCRKLGFRFDSSRNPQIPLIKPRKTSQISKARVPCRVFSTQSSTLGFQYEKLGFQFDSSRKPQIPIIQPSRTAAQISKFSVPAPNFSSDGLTPDFFPNRAQISVTYVLLSQSIGFPRNRQNLRIQPPWTSQIPNTRVPVRLLSTQPSKFPEYEMPTVTWGVIQGRKEKLVSRVIICDYLKNLGIIPDELEHLELPSTVEVMKERVEFLQKIGLTIDDINEYPLMLGCSVRKNIIPVLGYLEKIGISRSKLGEFVKNYPQVLHASVVVELVPVVRFLRGLDVERQDIPYVLQKYPELLGFKLDGTMSTSVAYLVSIGVSPRDIGPMVTQYPYILGMRVGTTIKPIVDYLVSLGLPKKVLARMFEKRAYILGYDLEETMKLNVDSLISFGIRIEVIPSVIAQYPQILGLPLKAKLSTQQYFFNLKLKIDPEGFARVIEKMPQIVSLNQSVIMKPIEFLRERGISIDDVAKMVVKCPQLVALRIALMKNSFYFLKSEMKRPMQELVEFPEYFTYSLESRIKPRYQRLSSKGINCSLAWFLNCSDQRFEERLRADFIEAESVGPSFCMGGKLQMPVSEIVSEEDEDESEDEILYRRTVSL